MELIYKTTKLLGDRGEQEVKALFDTEASQCFVRRDVAQAVATLSKGPYPFTFYVLIKATVCLSRSPDL